MFQQQLDTIESALARPEIALALSSRRRLYFNFGLHNNIFTAKQDNEDQGIIVFVGRIANMAVSGVEEARARANSTSAEYLGTGNGSTLAFGGEDKLPYTFKPPLALPQVL